MATKDFMMKTLLTLLLTLGTTFSLYADAENLYKNCAGCHGEKGELSALQQSALITGQESNLSIKELTAYKNGELNQYGMGNIMKLQLENISEEEIKELSEYIEAFELNSSK
jgi:cytochrome c553